VTGPRWRGAATRFVLWVVLGGWLGAWATFALLIAPLAFRVLPPGSAGDLIAPVLASLHGYGMAAGLVLAAVSWALGRGWVTTSLPLVLALVCAYSELVVTAGIEEAGPLAFGEGARAEAAQRFAALHRRSQWLFGGVGLGVVALVAAHALRDAREMRVQGD